MQHEKEFAIRQLLARSADCVWRKDTEGYAACWSKTGEWRLLGFQFNGRDEISKGWLGFMDPIRRVWQTSNNVALDVEGDTGYGRVFLEETLYMPDGAINLVRGIYHDSYRVEDGRWVFGKRHVDFYYLGPVDHSGRFFDVPDYGPGTRDPNPNRPASPSFQDAYG